MSLAAVPETAPGTAFEALCARLSRQSVDKHFDAYGDVDWDAPELQVDPADPRWELHDFDPVAGTDWYRAQPAEARSRLGLQRIAITMRTGWEFENVLQRGLLARAFWLPNGRPEFRYLHHEVIEESQHTMMFQELVNRAGLPAPGMPPVVKRAAERFVVPLARRAPALFFFFVLGGEEPIDFVQRRRLRAGIAHPLLERIIRIHVTEEARHRSFARHYLEREVPRLHPVRRATLAVAVPLLLGVMVRLMLDTPRSFSRPNRIPARALRAGRRSEDHRALRSGAVAGIRRLCVETGLLPWWARPLWRVLGIWSRAEAKERGPVAAERAR
jgi:hypothetical protein